MFSQCKVLRLLTFILLPFSASAQAQSVAICQTPTFWCSIPVAMPQVLVPTGLACHCNVPTNWGPQSINGYTLNPVFLQSPSYPQTTPSPAPSPLPDVEDIVENSPEASECFNGLGNCNGNFMSTFRNLCQENKSCQ